MYKVREFAKLAGVTVRALHHYDRLGLLKPGVRTESGYRLYRDCDLERLEQIVVLKFLGMALKEIGEVLKRETIAGEALRRQRAVLVRKRELLDAAIRAVELAEREPSWSALTRIIKEIEMQNDTEWTKQYYSEEAQAKVEERKALWSPELQERVSREWAELFADVEAAMGEDPASERAQELAGRWKRLVGEFTGGDGAIQGGLHDMYANQGKWPEQPRQNWGIKPEVMAFITAAMSAKR